MASKIDLISSAMVLIGHVPIDSLTGSGRLEIVANQLYTGVVQSEISKHRWGFARKKAQLSLTTDNPVDSEYKYIYQMPADMLVFIKVYPRINYQVLGDKLLCNVSTSLYCDYIADVSEALFPPYFAKVVEYALALSFAPAIRDSNASAELMARMYRDASNKAMYLDSQQHPQEAIVHHPFIEVRY